MDRRAFVATVGGTILVAPLVAEAQHARKVYRVGVLGNKSSDPVEAHLWRAWRLALQERGWLEGGTC